MTMHLVTVYKIKIQGLDPELKKLAHLFCVYYCPFVWYH
jgi:hypothetical protein